MLEKMSCQRPTEYVQTPSRILSHHLSKAFKVIFPVFSLFPNCTMSCGHAVVSRLPKHRAHCSSSQPRLCSLGALCEPHSHHLTQHEPYTGTLPSLVLLQDIKISYYENKSWRNFMSPRWHLAGPCYICWVAVTESWLFWKNKGCFCFFIQAHDSIQHMTLLLLNFL